MGPEKLGIDELKIFVEGACIIANTFGEAFEDGKISLGDVTDLFGVAEATQKLALVDYNAVLPEAKDLDPAEQKELVDLVKDTLSIPQVAIEQKVEDILEKSKALYEALYNMIGLVRSLKVA